jgi:F-type H+-transporting ATPase subunit delta
MASASDKESAIAKVYAAAILAAANAQKQADAVLDELSDLSAYLVKNPDFEGFLTTPMVDSKKREAAIEKLFRGRLSDLTVDSLQVINRKERLVLLRQIAQAFAKLFDAERGKVEVRVRTAVPVSGDVTTRIEQFAHRVTGKKASIVSELDDALIGGLIVEIDDRKFDMSVATQLREIGQALLDRAARDIYRGTSYVQ